MMSKISAHDVQVRELWREDLADMRRYFFDSPAEFLNSIGLKKPPAGESAEFQKRWEERFDQREAGGEPIATLTVLFRGERIGFHPSTHRIPKQSLIMHAHFFREDLRGLGIGTISYVHAIESFLLDYGYEEVMFKTPIQNRAPMKIKEKLGLESVGEEIVDWPETTGPLPCKVFRVTRADLPKLKARVGL